MEYIAIVAHLLGASMLLGGGILMTVMRVLSIKPRWRTGREFFDGIAQHLALFFWVGIGLVAVSGPVRLYQLTGTILPDVSTTWGTIVLLKVILFLPVMVKAGILSFYLWRTPGGKMYPDLRGPLRTAFMGYDLILVFVLLLLGAVLHAVAK